MTVILDKLSQKTRKGEKGHLSKPNSKHFFMWNFKSIARPKTKMPSVTTAIQLYLILEPAEPDIKWGKIGKKRHKLSLIADMIVYIENPR